MSDTIFEIKDLVKEFSSVRAVDNVSLTIKKGEAVFIVGPSGSGKSTVLRCLNFLEKPTSGEIILMVNALAALNGNWMLTVQKRGWYSSISIFFPI